MGDPKTLHLPDMLAHVQAKAAQDPSFRAAFLSNPKGTTELEFGITLPAIAQVAAVDTVVVVLPPLAESQGGLNDAELEAVAGGGKGDLSVLFGGRPGKSGQIVSVVGGISALAGAMVFGPAAADAAGRAANKAC